MAALDGMDGHVLGHILRTAADLALVIDGEGVIRDVYRGEEMDLLDAPALLGRPWTDTVTEETRAKITEMLTEAAATGSSRRRQVNHDLGGEDVPFLYSAIRLSPGSVLAVGRDLRSMSGLQQRLIEAQQAMERDYWRMRQMETRYRLLFRASAEAVLVVEANTGRVLEANPAAAELFQSGPQELIGKVFPFDLEHASHEAAEAYLETARRQGDAAPVTLRIAGNGEVLMSAAPLRQEDTDLLLVSLRGVDTGAITTAVEGLGDQAIQLLQDAPDAFLVTNEAGIIQFANRSFLDLAQLPTAQQAVGESISRWLGRPGADMQVLLHTLRQHGAVRLFATTLHGDLGGYTEIELSAVKRDVPDPLICILVRDIGRRLAASPDGARDLTRAVEQLTGLVGRVSLKKLIRDTVGLVEHHFIEAALELTGDNRTAAADLLGVSRQSLYVKLRRYNFDIDSAG